jgi:hypothetical protein
MLNIFNYDGQYFRVEVAEVAIAGDSTGTGFVSWCSDAFRELKDAPNQACTRLVPGQPLGESTEALHHAYDWLKTTWDHRKRSRPGKPGGQPYVIYSAWLYKANESSEFTFDEFSDAKLFAKAAEKISDVVKVGITNNESPQYLTVWEKPT